MRKAIIKRKTKEVNIIIKLDIDGKGEYKIDTKINFLNHMLSLLAKHGLFDIEIKARGDLDVDIHHTNEDIGISLGEAFLKALGKKVGIKRFGNSIVCMDEALVRCVLDISGRPYLKIAPFRLPAASSKTIMNIYKKNKVYTYSYFKQFLKGFVDHFKINLHIDVLEGEDFHHIAEASFKALALALKEAAKIEPRRKSIPTTKGKID